MLPTWVYEALPYLYAVAGAIVAMTLHNTMGAFAGGVLVVAGVTALFMRHRSRRRKTPAVAPPRARTADKTTPKPAASYYNNHD